MGEDTDGGLGCKYSYTIELRDTGEYGQLLPEWQIQPVYEEVYAGVRAMGDHILRELGFIVWAENNEWINKWMDGWMDT